MSTTLVLGPLLRHVDETTAAIWVEVAEAATVAVTAGERRAEARTFRVHDHHYALVSVEGLEPGSKTPYSVEVDGERVWPAPDTDLPPVLIATLEPGKPLRIAFGSCRTSVPHDESGNASHGVDALRAYALRMAGLTDGTHDDDPDPGDEVRWPDLVLFLGDQVYADQTSEAMREFIESRRDTKQAPGTELKDYEEYAHLYYLAWSDPVNRWLLATLPTAMIFDDHDIRDDWNTSREWKEAMEATDWWQERIVAGLSSYWVYQHLGNLAPADRAEDEIWRQIAAHDGPEEYDASAVLDAFAERADQEPDSYRWSYARRYGDQARLVVIDSRAARVLDPERRSILDDQELAWLDGQLRGDVEHLLIGTSLPFLLAPGLHYVEAFSEALASGGWGPRLEPVGEWLRRTVDLEHWAAFQRGFQQVAAMVLEVARGQRGRAPRSVTFLSGDVHHSYVSTARPTRREAQGAPPVRSAIVQAVCSPIRNPLSRRWRFATAFLSYGLAGPIGHVVARSAKVPHAPVRWRLAEGPWFDNNLGSLEVQPEGLRMWWATGVVDGDQDRPRLKAVAHFQVDA
jgi:phosphodiesterase/alkaline phosphatase D-like protein